MNQSKLTHGSLFSGIEGFTNPINNEQKSISKE